MSRKSQRPRIAGLYLLTDASVGDVHALVRLVTAAIDGGAAIVQYRDKGDDRDRRYREAEAILEVCRRRDVLCLINDDVRLAAELGADGVHLGEHDASLAMARRTLGAERLIGISCYNSLERARAAAAAGADYVAFGAFYPSATKPGARRAQPALLTEAKRELTVPLVAIGGIDASNAGALIAAGADAVAVVGAVCHAADPAAAARAIASQFHSGTMIT